MSKANKKYAKYDRDTTPCGKDPACARQTPRLEDEIKFHAPRRSRANQDEVGRTCSTK